MVTKGVAFCSHHNMKILISGYTGLGNFILKTPMIQSLRKLYPNAVIDVITDNQYGVESVLKQHDIINNIIHLSSKDSIVSKALFFLKKRKHKYDAIFLPFDAISNFLYFGSYLAGIKYRIGHKNLKKDQLRRLFSFKTKWIPFSEKKHEIDSNYNLLELYTNKPLMERPHNTLIQFDRDEEIINEFDLETNKYIVIQPGAANGLGKQKSWPTENFVRLIQDILSKNEYKIVLVGDQKDNEVFAQPILSKLDNLKKIVNSAGQTTINDLTNIINHARFVICHDSGVMHIADALSKNLIALYGPTNAIRTRPLKPTSYLVYSRDNTMKGIDYKDVINIIDKQPTNAIED